MSRTDSTNLPDGVCVVTQPGRRESGKTHAHQLLDLLAASTSVVLLTMNLASDSTIREEHSVIELSKTGTGDSLPVTLTRFIWNQVVMARAITRRDEEVVLFFGATAYVLPMLVTRAVGKTLVVEPRGDVPLSLRLKWENQVPSPVTRVLAYFVYILEHVGYILSDAVVTYTPSMAAELGLTRYAHKLHTEGLRYVDVERFQPETSFEQRDVAVGYIGRLDVEKRIPTLVESVKRLPEDISVRFVGDGDYRKTVERELARNIEAGQVELTGWVDHTEVPTQLNQMRLLLLTSEATEGLPTVILEAFACGTPVYATPVSGVPDVVQDGETGFLMTEDDPDVIAATIERALTGDRLAEMSNTCRDLAVAEFSFEASVERYRRILASVAD